MDKLYHGFRLWSKRKEGLLLVPVDEILYNIAKRKK